MDMRAAVDARAFGTGDMAEEDVLLESVSILDRAVFLAGIADANSAAMLAVEGMGGTAGVWRLKLEDDGVLRKFGELFSDCSRLSVLIRASPYEVVLRSWGSESRS